MDSQPQLQQAGRQLMSKFVQIESAVLSTLGAFQSEVKVVPLNVSNTTLGEFVRASIILSADNNGILSLEIYTASGEGTRRASEIADKLDLNFVRKYHQQGRTGLQFFESAMVHRGLDAVNKSLYKSVYEVPFQFYGEI